MNKLERVAIKFDMLGIKYEIIDGCLVRETSEYNSDIYVPYGVEEITPKMMLMEKMRGSVYIHGDAEIKRFNISCNKGITELTLDIDVSQCKTGHAMFDRCRNLVKVDFKRFDTSNFVSMRSMFSWCRKLTKVNIERLNTKSCVTFAGMFEECDSLVSLDISTLDTSNVTAVNAMFAGCIRLKNLDTSTLRLPKVTNMAEMFRECESLTSIDISNLGTTKRLNQVEQLFLGCSELEYVNITGLNLDNVTSTFKLFAGCSNLREIKGIEGLNVRHLDDMSLMFSDCVRLENIDTSKWITTGDCMYARMFSKCESLKSVNIQGFDIEDSYQIQKLFHMCTKLEELHIRHFCYNAKYVDYVTIISAFVNCMSLSRIVIHTTTDSFTDPNELLDMLTNLFQREYLQIKSIPDIRIQMDMN